MRLIKAKTFASRYFDPEDRPDERTVRDWVRRGEVAGRLAGRLVYVDADAWEGMTGDKLADKILGDGGARK